MTGNNKVWRAPLAGLAAVAMLATMGVAASTANAANHDVTVEGLASSVNASSVNVWDGESLEDAVARHSAGALDNAYGYTVDGKAYNPSQAVTAGATVKKVPNTVDSVPVTLKLSADKNSAQMINGKYYEGDVTLHVKKGDNAKLSDYFDIKDAANGHRVTSWKLVDGTQTVASADTLAEVLSYTVASSTGITVTPVTVKPAAKITFTRPDNWNNNAHYAGSWSDGDSTADLVLDGLKGETLNAPTYVYTDNPVGEFDRVSSWAETESGDTVDFGGKFTVGEKASYKYEPSDKTEGAEVSFDSNGGSYVASKHVDANKQISKPADPTRDGYTFAGWKIAGVRGVDYELDEGAVDAVTGIIYRFDGVRFLKNVTLTAQWTATYDIRVTFHYGDYEGAPADTTATYKPNDFLTEPAEPTREGYLFKGWYKADGSEFDFNNTLVANGASSSNANFVLTALWQRAYTDDAENALNYVKVKDFHSGNVNPGEIVDGKVVYGDDSAYFTDASWKAFSAEYKKAYQKYESAKHNAVNGEIDSATAADVVNTLSAAWKGLRFSAEHADTVLDGDTANKDGENTAQVVYRLAQGSARHLLTGDEVEVKALTNKHFGQGGWTLDSTNFRTVYNINGKSLTHPEWVENEKANTDLGFAPLLKQVSRVYNGKEHMYTSDAVEIGALLERGWSKDSNLASFFVPAQYTTSTRIVRLYNKATGAHLFTSDKVEINYLTTQKGWVQESDLAGFYAL